MAESLQPNHPRTMLDYARAYAARGWSVVPVRPGEKIPAVPWAQFQHRRASDQELCDWFGDGRMGIGIVTGAISGFFVADFDGEEGHRTHDKIGAHLPGPASLTGGGGIHVLCRHPGIRIPTRKGLAPGMDIRGDGGFIVAPPSVHSSGSSYQWDVDNHPDDVAMHDAPAWFIDRITADAPPGPGHAAPVQRGAGPLGLDLGQITDGRETYMRNTILAVCRELRDKLGRLPTTEELTEAAWPQYASKVDFSRPGRGPDEFAAKVAYTLRRAASGAVRGLEAPADPFGEAGAESGGTEAPGLDVFPTYGIGDIIAMPPPVWLVEGIITTDGVGGIYGPPASLKSFLALGMALCIAYGKPWMDRETKQAGILYVAAEGVRGMGRRIRAWQHKNGLAGVDAPFRLLAATVNLTEPEQAAKLIRTAIAAAEAEGCQIGLVIIDTVARAMAGADENSAQDMGRFIAGLDAIKAEVGCAVLGIHHSGKDATRGARGSSAFLGAMDMLGRVERSEMGDLVTLIIEKQKEDEEGDPLALSVEKVDLGGGLKPESSLVLNKATDQPKPQGPDTSRMDLVDRVARIVGEGGRAKLPIICDGLGRIRNGHSYSEITNAIPFAPSGVDVTIDGKRLRLWCAKEGKHATAPIVVVCHAVP